LRFSSFQKLGNFLLKSPDSHIWFHCMARNIEGWLKISTLFLIYSHFRGIIGISSTSSYGWLPLWPQTKNSPKKKHWYELPILRFNQRDTFLRGFGGRLIFMNIPSRKKEAYCTYSKKENEVKGLPRPGL
jgi:hypothetical protein